MDASRNSLVVVIDDYMFDLTRYADEHPGGKKILLRYDGKDATAAFNRVRGHSDSYVIGLLDELCIGKSEKIEPSLATEVKSIYNLCRKSK